MDNTYDFLMNNGSASIRYRTLIELIEKLLTKLEMMAHFKTTINNEWFKNWMIHLESFKT